MKLALVALAALGVLAPSSALRLSGEAARAASAEAAEEGEVSTVDALITAAAAELHKAKALLLNALEEVPKAKEAKKPKEDPKPTVKASAPAAKQVKAKAAGNATAVAAPTAAKAAAKKSKAGETDAAGVPLAAHAAVEVALAKHNMTAALAGEKGILEGLFSHLKMNIANFNVEEKSSKSENEAILKKWQDKLKKDTEKLKQPNLSAFEHEVLVNRTKDEQETVAYWSRGRELSHSMYHSNLKLTHGLMQRLKTVMGAYEQAIHKGKVDKKTLKSLNAASLPGAFVEMHQELRRAKYRSSAVH